MKDLTDRFPVTHPLAKWSVDSNRLLVNIGQRWVRMNEDLPPDELSRFLKTLDGSCSVAELADLFAAPLEAVASIVGGLEDNGFVFVLESKLVRGSEASVFSSLRQGVPIDVGRSRLLSTPICVLGRGRVANQFCQLIDDVQLAGCTRRDFSEKLSDAFIVAAPPREEVAALTDLNRKMLSDNHSWMQILPFDGQAFAVGPIFIPYETACFECFARRRRANSAGEDPLAFQNFGPHEDIVGDSMAANVGAMLLVDWITSERVSLPGRCFYVGNDLNGPSLTRSIVRRVPRCPECSFVERITPLLEWSRA